MSYTSTHNRQQPVESVERQQLISMKRNFNWFVHLIIGDEKWVMHVNHIRTNSEALY